MGNELGLVVGTTNQLKPVKHRRGVRFNIAAGAMGPKTFAGDDVCEAVAIDVGEYHGMVLREDDSVLVGIGPCVLFGQFIENEVLLEGDLVLALDLLVPREPIAMGIKAGDDVIETVAIHVVGVHLGTARARS